MDSSGSKRNVSSVPAFCGLEWDRNHDVATSCHGMDASDRLTHRCRRYCNVETESSSVSAVLSLYWLNKRSKRVCEPLVVGVDPSGWVEASGPLSALPESGNCLLIARPD